MNLDKKIFWQHISVSGLGMNMFHRVLGKLRWSRRIDSVQVNEGENMLHKYYISLILIVVFSRRVGVCT